MMRENFLITVLKLKQLEQVRVKKYLDELNYLIYKTTQVQRLKRTYIYNHHKLVIEIIFRFDTN